MAQHKARLPHPSSIIASSYTSPIDSLYLAAVFDPVFTASYPSTHLVHQISLFQAILGAFQHPKIYPPRDAVLVELKTIVERNPRRIIVVYPECSTTNGQGILQLSTSLITAQPMSKIFPVSLRYTPADITTPIPGKYVTFLWNLLSKPTHCIRVRIAESVSNPSTVSDRPRPDFRDQSSKGNLLDTDVILGSDGGDGTSVIEREVLIKVAEALARLGRVKRVGLSVKDKVEFIDKWDKANTKRK